jgi:hypothetical protein
MPAKSKAQAIAMRIAEHAPEKLYARNKAMLGMSHQQLHDFAATKNKGLPKRKGPAPKGKEVPLSHALKARRR